MNNWKEKSVFEFGQIITGSTPSTKNIKFWGGEVPFYSPADFDGSKYCLSTERTVTDMGLKQGRILDVNSVLFTCIGSIGKIAINRKKGISNQQINTIVVNSDFNYEYIYYLLLKNAYKFQSFAPKTTIPIINKSDFGKFTFRVPKKSHQQKIAKILNTVDSVIEKTKQTVNKYQSIKNGMLQDLFSQGIDIRTGNLRSNYEDAPELYKKSALGWIPKEWEVKKLKEVVEVRVSNVDKKIHPNKKLVRLCNYMDAYRNDFISDKLEFTIGSANTNEVNRFELLKDDVIITKDSETPDDIAIPSVVVEDLNNVVCGYHLAILRPLKNCISGIFLMYNLKLPQVQNYFFRMAGGSTRYGLTIGGIENVSIAVPKEDEQKEISNRMLKIDELIVQEQKNLEKHHNIKKGLMQDLLTGKVEVNA